MKNRHIIVNFLFGQSKNIVPFDRVINKIRIQYFVVRFGTSKSIDAHTQDTTHKTYFARQSPILIVTKKRDGKANNNTTHTYYKIPSHTRRSFTKNIQVST